MLGNFRFSEAIMRKIFFRKRKKEIKEKIKEGIESREVRFVHKYTDKKCSLADRPKALLSIQDHHNIRNIR